MADKHTKRELFETLLVFASAAEAEGWILDGLQHELDLLAKRASAKGGDAKKKAAQRAVKDDIIIALEDAESPMKATPIADAIGVSVQKASALLRQMVLDGEVTRIEDKKEVFFSLT
jgi:hypothetical protein